MNATVIDTCCLINLYASGYVSEIVSTSIGQAFIPKIVCDEVLYIREDSEDSSDTLIPVRVDLRSLVQQAIVLVTELADNAELERFVEFATVLDDGEAACLSIAVSRGMNLATDDRRAQRVAADVGVPTMSTPELLKTWLERALPGSVKVADAIRQIERYGRFKPHHSSQYAKWWSEQSQFL